jgi:thioesterase domain-containing protein
MTANEAKFDRAYLQERIAGEFILAKHIGVMVESADDAAVILRAPLAPNANYKGTAFGGSLYAVAVLAGWAWVTRYLATREFSADAVIQESSMRYLLPVRGEMCASAIAPTKIQIDKFLKMLHRAGRGRLSVQVDVHCENTLSTQFDGVFAAAVRQ